MNSTRSTNLLSRRPGFTRSGFTMVEMIVTVGILMVVAAGIATIFSSVGDTVSKGRKLSELNQFAARIERIMREDFESMTRDGFLVIVNRNANFGQDVRLFRGEQTNIDENLYGGTYSGGPGRVRRSDEIMFFTRGEYETARRAISPDMIARSSEAAIYYGHGQKRRPQLTGINGINNFFFNPAPWDSNFDFVSGFNQAGVGITSTVGAPNPNEFARDWALVRQVTLLSPPIGESRNVPRELFGYDRGVGAQRAWLMDSDRQIALQPASRSIFNSLGWSDPSRVLPGSTDPIRWLGDNAVNQLNLRELPQYRASGVVDIVTEDLATIRGMIQSLPVKVSPFDYAFFDEGSGFGANIGADVVVQNRDQFEFDYWATASDANAVIPDPKDADELNLTLASHRLNMRQWMIDALPSRWDTSFTPPRHLAGVRYEDIPTRIMYPEGHFDVSDQGDLERAYAESHQEMLGSSIFVPRCTEFIVEWSYGFLQDLTNPASPNYKKMIWYGLDRYVDSNNDGVLSLAGPNPDQRAAVPYSQRVLVGSAAIDPATGRPRALGMDPNLVVGVNRLPVPGGNPPPLPPDAVEIATFGFMDPRGTPDVSDDVEWLWPKFIRITMSLGDPADPEIEQTYQVIFELPERE